MDKSTAIPFTTTSKKVELLSSSDPHHDPLFSQSFWHIPSGSNSFGMRADLLSGIWHIFWYSFWHSTRYIFGDSLWFRSGGEHCDPELAVEVRQGTLWSGACVGSLAGNTLIRSLRWRSGGEHCNLELAAKVRRGTLRSRACSWGPAGITLIQRLLFRSGGDHFDPEVAVQVRQGTLRSRACSWGPVGTLWSGACGGGPAGNTLILSLRWRSCGEHTAI